MNIHNQGCLLGGRGRHYFGEYLPHMLPDLLRLCGFAHTPYYLHALPPSPHSLDHTPIEILYDVHVQYTVTYGYVKGTTTSHLIPTNTHVHMHTYSHTHTPPTSLCSVPPKI